MAAGKWKIWIDDTGAIGDGTYTELTNAIATPLDQTRTTTVQPVCIGDDYETEEPIVMQAGVALQIKHEKGNALEARLLAAYKAGTQVGVQIGTGDVTASGADGTGHLAFTMNALVKSLTLGLATGSARTIDIQLAPHADSTVDPTYIVSTGS